MMTTYTNQQFFDHSQLSQEIIGKTVIWPNRDILKTFPPAEGT